MLKSKPEEEFYYGGRLFLQNGNSYITSVDWVILTIFGMLIDIDLLKKVTSPSPIRKQNCATAATILKIDKTSYLRRDKTSYLRREWSESDIGEMWHADTEWHVSYDDEVKIETENDDGLKKIAYWSCRYVSPGCYSNVRPCVFTRDIQMQFTKQRYWHTVRTDNWTILRLYRRNRRQRLPKTIS